MEGTAHVIQLRNLADAAEMMDHVIQLRNHVIRLRRVGAVEGMDHVSHHHAKSPAVNVNCAITQDNTYSICTSRARSVLALCCTKLVYTMYCRTSTTRRVSGERNRKEERAMIGKVSSTIRARARI